ncbi:GTPase-activator protein [Ostertagia ostertagi]
MHSSVGRCLSILYTSPLGTAELLHAIGQNQELSADDSIHAMFSLVYGNCVFPSDEKAVLETLNCLIRVQLLTHNNPRLVIRKGTAAFPRLYKLYSDSLYAAKIFLTAALHDSVMLVLCQDEVFLDIDPAKSPLRFPSADRVRRFGDDPTSAQYHKRVAAHRKLIVEKLVLLAHSFIKGICDAISCFPLGLIWLVQQLNSSLTEIKRLNVCEATLICTDLIVTNLLCPAIINPENVGIISDTPISHIARFNLMQIGQIIQTLALSRYETPQPHFHIFAAQFKDSPICDIVGSLLSRSLGSFDSLFPPVLCESHRSRELFRRTYFMGSVAEVNAVMSILHSNALSSVSSNELRAEIDALRSRIPKLFSTSSTLCIDPPAESVSVAQPRSNKMRNLADKG